MENRHDEYLTLSYPVIDVLAIMQGKLNCDFMQSEKHHLNPKQLSGSENGCVNFVLTIII